MTIHRSAARLGGAQSQMSEPHILKLPWSRGTTAATKGGSMSGAQMITRARKLLPVPIAAEVLIEDATTMHDVALSDRDSAVFLR